MDFARGEVAVLDALRHVVFINRLAEVFAVVGIDLQVGGCLLGFLGDFDFARRGGEANLHGVRVAREHLRPFAPCGAMALINDDVAEIIFGIERGQEIGRAVLGVHVERLVSSDVNPGVAGMIQAVRLAINLGGFRAEHILQRAESLAAKLVAVADEQRAAKLAGVGDAFEQMDGDKSFASARGQREQGALFAARDLLQHGADGGVLIVAPRGLAAGVANEQRFGDGRIEFEASGNFVTRPQFSGRWKFRERLGRGGLAGERIKFDKEVAVAGKDERDIHPFARAVEFALFKSMTGRQIFGLRLNERDGHRLRPGIYHDAQRVINAPLRPFARLAVNDFDCAGGFLAPNQILSPATAMDGGINQFGARVRFTERHEGESSARGRGCKAGSCQR